MGTEVVEPGPELAQALRQNRPWQDVPCLALGGQAICLERIGRAWLEPAPLHRRAPTANWSLLRAHSVRACVCGLLGECCSRTAGPVTGRSAGGGGGGQWRGRTECSGAVVGWCWRQSRRVTSRHVTAQARVRPRSAGILAAACASQHIIRLSTTMLHKTLPRRDHGLGQKRCSRRRQR